MPPLNVYDICINYLLHFYTLIIFTIFINNLYINILAI